MERMLSSLSQNTSYLQNFYAIPPFNDGSCACVDLMYSARVFGVCGPFPRETEERRRAGHALCGVRRDQRLQPGNDSLLREASQKNGGAEVSDESMGS